MDSPWEITSPTLTTASSYMSSYATPRSSRMSRSSTISSSASTSSFHEVGTPGSDSEDEIVYSVASLPELEQPQTPYMFSDGDEDDDDYVVLRRRPAGAQGFDTATGSGVATPSAGEGAATRATSGRGSSSSGALRGQVMVVQLRSQLKALSLNTQSPSTSTSPTTTKRTGTSTATSKKLQREDDDSELNVNARASGLPTPDITPLKARIQRQPSGNTSLTGALIISELPSSPQSVATPTTTLPSVGKKKLKKKAKKAAALAAAKASTDSGSVAATTSDGALKKGKKSKSKKATTTAPKNATSEAKQGKAGQVDRGMVLEASTYITSYLSNPKAQTNTVCRLTLLQSLIIELGLMTSALNLPASLRSAKAFLKSHAFLNIKEYVSVRAQGPDAVRRILFPSRTALIKDIRKKRNPVSLTWVKEHGLQVLLVGCF